MPGGLPLSVETSTGNTIFLRGTLRFSNIQTSMSEQLMSEKLPESSSERRMILPFISRMLILDLLSLSKNHTAAAVVRRVRKSTTSQASTQSWLTSTTISSVVIFFGSTGMSVLALLNQHRVVTFDP
jgi:hypothetical protein